MTGMNNRETFLKTEPEMDITQFAKTELDLVYADESPNQILDVFYPYVCIWKRMEFLLHVRLHITLNLKSKESLHSGEKNTIVSRNVVSRMA